MTTSGRFIALLTQVDLDRPLVVKCEQDSVASQIEKRQVHRQIYEVVELTREQADALARLIPEDVSGYARVPVVP